jgi:hypothetical protein
MHYRFRIKSSERRQSSRRYHVLHWAVAVFLRPVGLMGIAETVGYIFTIGHTYFDPK